MTKHAFACSNSTVETVEQDMKSTQFKNKDIRTTSVLVFCLLTLSRFHIFF